MSRRSTGELRWVLLAPAVVGVLALVVVTRRGAHASPDSAFYVGLARNIAGGVGWESSPGSFPLSHFPPLFPVVLAVFGWLGVDPLDAAGWINPVLFGVSAALVAVVVRRATGSVGAGVAAAVALVVSRDLLFASATALSEPLFILLTLATLVALGRHLETGRTGWLGAAAALAAASTLTRYAGVALVVVGVAAVVSGAGAGGARGSGPGGDRGFRLRWGFGRGSDPGSGSAPPPWSGRRGGRLVAAGAFVVGALGPTMMWLALAGSGDRPLGWHPFGTDYLLVAGRSLSAWVLPRFLPWPARGVLALAVVTVVAVLIVRARARPGHAESHQPGQPAEDRAPVAGVSAGDGPASVRSSLGRVSAEGALGPGRAPDGAAAGPPGGGLGPVVALCVIFAVVYIGMLVLQNVFLDASSTLDYRLLAPLHAVAVVGGAIALAPRLANFSHVALPSNLKWEKLAREWVVVACVLAVLVAAQALGAVAWVAGAPGDDSPERRGLTAAAWEDSAVLAAVAELPADVVVYSNAPDAVHLLTGRRAVALVPPRVDYLSGRDRPDYAPEMADLATAVRQGSAVVAWFGAAPWRRSLYPPESTIVATLGLDPLPAMEDEVGRLYRTLSRTGVVFAPGSVQEMTPERALGPARRAPAGEIGRG